VIDQLLDILEGLQFRDLDAEFLRGLWPAIVEIVQNPTSNIPAAILILVIVTTVLLIVGSLVFLFLLGDDDDDEEETELVQVTVAGEAQAAPVTKVVRVRYVKDPLRHHKRVLIVAGAGLALLSVTGYTTQSNAVCTSCHVGTPHVEPSDVDAHRNVACVRCHEGTTLLSSVTLSAVPRVVHFVSAAISEDTVLRYRAVTGRGCRRCHSDVAEAVVEIPNRALRVSHKEPLEAGAGCLDCHILDGDERISQVTAGMAPCLRCHNNAETSADCAVCHTGDVSKAVIATHTRSTNNARELVPSPDCYSCHDPEPCDSCHGVRLPHPPEYVARGHMRDAAADLWANDGATCYACHTDTHRSCYGGRCHEFEMPLHTTDGSFGITHRSEPVGSCDGCHNKYGLFANACLMCHPETP
jgi:hypothetical protein